MMLKRRRSLSVLVLVVLAVAGMWVAARMFGCATPEGFRTEAIPVQPADLLAGSWEGTWKSSSKPLGGRLSAIIEKKEDGEYHASFTSQTPFGEDKSICVYHVAERSDTPPLWKFNGKRDLGILKGGTYKYDGTVDAENFTCTYDSAFDKGIFQMQRKP